MAPCLGQTDHVKGGAGNPACHFPHHWANSFFTSIIDYCAQSFSLISLQRVRGLTPKTFSKVLVSDVLSGLSISFSKMRKIQQMLSYISKVLRFFGSVVFTQAWKYFQMDSIWMSLHFICNENFGVDIL